MKISYLTHMIVYIRHLGLVFRRNSILVPLHAKRQLFVISNSYKSDSYNTKSSSDLRTRRRTYISLKQ